jgi:transposase-like protein
MATYSKEFKEKLIKLMLPPKNKSVKELVEEYHIHEQTLYRWRKEAKSKGTVYQDNKGTKQKYSKEMQLQIIIETSQLNSHDLSEYCRRKGIYAEEIAAWKKAYINGETDEQSKIKQELKDKDAELKRTKKELDRKEKALAEAAALLVLKKKMQAIWNSDEEN